MNGKGTVGVKLTAEARLTPAPGKTVEDIAAAMYAQGVKVKEIQRDAVIVELGGGTALEMRHGGNDS